MPKLDAFSVGGFREARERWERRMGKAVTSAMGLPAPAIRSTGTPMPILPAAFGPSPGRGSFGVMAGWINSVASDMWFTPGQPVAPQAPPETQARSFDYPVGINIMYVPRSEEDLTFAQLRSLADLWDLLRLVIETRKDQVSAVDWTVRPVRDPDEPTKVYQNRARTDETADEIRKKLAKPDGELDFRTWLRKLMEDQLVVDAVAILPDPNDGRLEIMDGATIKRLIDNRGRTPRPTDGVAYQQVIKGVPAVNFTSGMGGNPDTPPLYYFRRNVRAHKIYGMSPVEQCAWTINLAIRRALYKIAYYCYSDDTEVLTKRGWLPFAACDDTDEFATRRIGTGEFEWQRSYDFFREDYQGDLIHLRGQSVDLLVTPEHRVLLSGQPAPGDAPEMISGGEYVISAEQLANRGVRVGLDRIPRTSSWAGQPVEKQRFPASDPRAKAVVMSGDDFCAFMGMYLAEGNLAKAGRIAISQPPDTRGAHKLYGTLLRRLFGKVYYGGHQFEVTRKSVADYLRRFGKAHEKFVPEIIRNATPEQLAIFWKYYYIGDGRALTGTQTTQQAFTVSRRLADHLTEICQKLGYAVNVWTRAASSVACVGARTVTAREGYLVSASNGDAAVSSVTRVPYTGPVACVCVPNKFLYVRRNGKAVWSGNTEGNMPEAFIKVPEEWGLDQVRTFSEWFDSLLAGQVDRRRRAFFIPGITGSDSVIFPKQDMLKDEMDEWLVTIACYALGVSKEPFVRMMNRGTAVTSQEAARAEGLAPVLRWVEQCMTTLIQEPWGYAKYEFVFESSAEFDLLKKAQRQSLEIRNGIKGPDQIAEENGDDPPGVGPGIVTATGFVPFDRLDEMMDKELEPDPRPIIAGAAGQNTGAAPAASTGGGSTGAGQKGGDMSKTTAADAWRSNRGKRRLKREQAMIERFLARMGQAAARAVEPAYRKQTGLKKGKLMDEVMGHLEDVEVGANGNGADGNTN